MSARLRMALDTGGLTLPDAGPLCVLHPPADADLTDLPKDRVRIVQPVKPDHDRFKALGYDCVTSSDDGAAAVLICLPRSKALAHALVAQACAICAPDGVVIVDGAKTDGVDSLFKACRARCDVAGSVSKAHGRVFWLAPKPDAFADWMVTGPDTVDGCATVPGVFSADGIDPASRALASALPDLSGHVVDLGAGWGYLSARLAQMAGVKTIDLVEADQRALDCARLNVRDARARFHWADASDWLPDARADTVVMNPPFHVGRAANPMLGQAFIRTAARCLAPNGQLWMVANRHLPYEATLGDVFAAVEETAGDGRFKILRAQRPVQAGKSRKPQPIRTRR